MMRFCAVLVVAGVFVSSAAFSQPDPTKCILGANLPVAKQPFISIEGSAFGAPDNCVDGRCADYVVVVNDAFGAPIGGASVVVDFSQCCDMMISCNQLTAATGQSFVAPARVSGTTNAVGAFTFKVQGAANSTGPDTPGTPLGVPCARVYANGVLLGSLKVSAYDIDGQGVSATDVSRVNREVLGNCTGVRYQRTDVNADGVVDNLDVNFMSQLALDAAAGTGSPVTAPYCSQIPICLPADATHYWTYRLETPKDTLISIDIADQFISQTVTLDTLSRLVNWVVKNQSLPRDTSLHFTWWDIHEKVPVKKSATITNQFGTFGLHVDSLDFLLAPAAKNDPNGPPACLSHYLCYKAAEFFGPRKRFYLKDEWRQDTLVVDSMAYLCVPCRKSHNGVNYPPTDTVTHLAVYQVHPSSDLFAPSIQDQFVKGNFAVRQRPKEFLFVPSRKTNITSVEPREAKTLRILAAPNPGHAGTAIFFSLSAASRVSVEVLDIAGRLVRSVAREQTFGAGQYSLIWDGRASTGVACRAGVYFVRLRSGSHQESVRFVLVP